MKKISALKHGSESSDYLVSCKYANIMLKDDAEDVLKWDQPKFQEYIDKPGVKEELCFRLQ